MTDWTIAKAEKIIIPAARSNFKFLSKGGLSELNSSGLWLLLLGKNNQTKITATIINSDITIKGVKRLKPSIFELKILTPIIEPTITGPKIVPMLLAAPNLFDENSVILTINTEADTYPESYQKIIASI